MKLCLATVRDPKLRVEIKPKCWAIGRLKQPHYFIHGTSASKMEIQANGISCQKAKEWVTFDTCEGRGGDQYVFAFPWTDSTGDDLETIDAPAPVKTLWGRPPLLFIFLAPAGTWFACENGAFWNYPQNDHSQPPNIHKSMEVAFPYIVEASDIVNRFELVGRDYKRF